MNTLKKKIFGKRVLITLAVVFLLIAFWVVYRQNVPKEKVSEFGKYQGYSEAV